MLLATWYTDDYADLLHRWKAVASATGRETLAIHVPFRGAWLQAVNMKPIALYMLLAVRADGEEILFTDVDADIVQAPEIGQHQMESFLAPFHIRPSGARELLSGTIWIRKTEAARELVAAWKRECEAHPERTDQRNLDAVYHHRAYLPREWAYMEGLEARQPGVVQCAREAAYIIHHQVSRQRRNK